jgi:hypothetical protein
VAMCCALAVRPDHADPRGILLPGFWGAKAEQDVAAVAGQLRPRAATQCSAVHIPPRLLRVANDLRFVMAALGSGDASIQRRAGPVAQPWWTARLALQTPGRPEAACAVSRWRTAGSHFVPRPGRRRTPV